MENHYFEWVNPLFIAIFNSNSRTFSGSMADVWFREYFFAMGFLKRFGPMIMTMQLMLFFMFFFSAGKDGYLEWEYLKQA